jgi:hypothetical protein
MRLRKLWVKSLGLSLLLGGFVFAAGVPAARAENFDSCYRNVQKLENKLDKDINRHGSNSKQAFNDRRSLRDARQRCENRFGNSFRNRSNNRYRDNDDRYRSNDRDFDRGYDHDYYHDYDRYDPRYR